MQVAIATTDNAVAPPTGGRRHNAKNEKFANDASFESVDAMLQGLAIKCFRRVDKLGLSMTMDDVRQELNLHYLKAKEKWNPEKGVLFSSYCYRVCLNNFNNAIERQEIERTQFGMVSYEDVRPSHFGGEDHDPMEFFESGDAEMSTEDKLVAREAFTERMRSLSAGARKLALALLNDERNANGAPPAKLRELAASVGLQGDELRQVKQEILNKFGIRWL